MKKIYIDNKNGIVMVNGKKIPFLLLCIIRGAIGKQFVVKHYRNGRIVITKYPDMSGIVASAKQRVRRDLFREAVVYAKWIISDKERKKAFRKSLPRRKQQKVYQAAIQLYMSRQGDKQWLRKQLAVKSMVRAQESNRQWKIGNTSWVPGNQQYVIEGMPQIVGNLKGAESCEGGRTMTRGNEQREAWDVWWQKKEEAVHVADRDKDDIVVALCL